MKIQKRDPTCQQNYKPIRRWREESDKATQRTTIVQFSPRKDLVNWSNWGNRKNHKLRNEETGEKLKHLRYADDIVLFARNPLDMKGNVERPEEKIEKYRPKNEQDKKLEG